MASRATEPEVVGAESTSPTPREEGLSLLLPVGAWTLPLATGGTTPHKSHRLSARAASGRTGPQPCRVSPPSWLPQVSVR